MYAKVESLGLNGLDAFSVTVEADISTGLPRFDIVGLPDMAVRESRERVRATIKNGGYQFPVSRMTVNIAPADVKKEGAVYDLPVFVALMKASGQIHGSTWTAKSGPAPGCCPWCCAPGKKGCTRCLFPLPIGTRAA